MTAFVLIGSPRDFREEVEHGEDGEDTGDDGGPPVDSDAPEPVRRSVVASSLWILCHRQMVT